MTNTVEMFRSAIRIKHGWKQADGTKVPFNGIMHYGPESAAREWSWNIYPTNEKLCKKAYRRSLKIFRAMFHNVAR